MVSHLISFIYWDLSKQIFIRFFFILTYRFTPHYMYNKNVYPDYLSGTGYLMSMDTAAKLYNASMKTPLLHLEDVYLTGKLNNNTKKIL